MEHFHINKIPSYFYTEDTLTGLDSYTSFQGGDTNGITLDQLKSKDVDYFTLYFSRSGNLNSQSDIWMMIVLKNYTVYLAVVIMF